MNRKCAIPFDGQLDQVGRADRIGEMLGKRVKILAPKFTQQESFRLQARNENGERAIHGTSFFHSRCGLCVHCGSWLDLQAASGPIADVL